MGTDPDIAESDRIIGSSALLAQHRAVLRLKHYSIRTDVAYLAWINRCILIASERCEHPRSGRVRRHRFGPSVVQKAVNRALRTAGVHNKASTHALPPSFPNHILADGYDIRAVQQLIRHSDVRTTMTTARYRYAAHTGTRLKTVELVEQSQPPSASQPRAKTSHRSTDLGPSDRFVVRSRYNEMELRHRVTEVRRIRRPQNRMWGLTYAQIPAKGLEERIVQRGSKLSIYRY
jgi:hypothetical protein